MKATVIDASPTKAFFVENLTRDLSLEDALLDLIDNSIDAAIQTYGIDVSPALLVSTPASAGGLPSPMVEVDISPDGIEVRDWAGGIDPALARDHVFRLGRAPMEGRSTLGVYGIGLKRAIFKIGADVVVESRHKNGGFRVAFNVPEWLDDDTDWSLPMAVLPAARTRNKSGTRIAVTGLRPEIRMKLGDPSTLRRLRTYIASTYALFLEQAVKVNLNGHNIPPDSIPLGESDRVLPGKVEMKQGDVHVELFAGLAARREDDWQMERAGWYVLCNGRVVVSANKDQLTGWGTLGPQFVSKYRGFVGVAFFYSNLPGHLPWTTTKRGLNLESEVFQKARREMTTVARPVLRFLNNMYPSEAKEEVVERDLANTVKPATLKSLSEAPAREFSTAVVPRKTQPRSVSVQFKAKVADIERVKRCLAKPGWGASQVGRHALQRLIETECAE